MFPPQYFVFGWWKMSYGDIFVIFSNRVEPTSLYHPRQVRQPLLSPTALWPNTEAGLNCTTSYFFIFLLCFPPIQKCHKFFFNICFKAGCIWRWTSISVSVLISVSSKHRSVSLSNLYFFFHKFFLNFLFFS